MTKIFYFLWMVPFIGWSQTTSQNYVKNTSYNVPTLDGTTINNSGAGVVTEEMKTVTVNYFDDQGRPSQKVSYRQSASGKDIINAISYDAYGRRVREYLPYPATTATMAFRTQADVSAGLGTYAPYSGQTTYSAKLLETSPLGRILKQGAPGNDWALPAASAPDHTVKFESMGNTGSEVRIYNVVFPSVGGVEDTEDTGLSCTGYYVAQQLHKSVVKDENWTEADGNNKTIQEFTDKDGNVILRRLYNNNVRHDTYYVYDDFGNLTYVIPPLAADNIAIGSGPLTPLGTNFPWTGLTLVDKQLADNYDRALGDYDNSEILNADLLNEYGGQGGFSITSDGTGNLSLTINITTIKAMPYRTGIITNLKGFGIFNDKELGRIQGANYKYIFLIRGNNLVVTGDGNPVPSLNVTLTGEQKLDYSHNYPWTALCDIDPNVAKQYETAIAGLDNSEILTTYTNNPYTAQGGVAMGLDANDNLTISLNITTTTPLEFKNGSQLRLDIGRRLADGYLGSSSGDGFSYEFNIKDNTVVVTGSGFFTHINFTGVRSPANVTYTIRQEVLEGLCYIYHYDYLNRVVEKHIPDNGWTDIVYDRLDRPILIQDENMRAKINTTPNWLVTKYDKFNRVVYTGQVRDSRVRNNIQQALNTAVNPVVSESRATTTFTNSGATVHYTNVAFPTNTELFTINYYDDYGFDLSGITITAYNFYNTTLKTNAKGLATGSKTRVLGTTNWITSITGYDWKAREIWSRSKNPFLGTSNNMDYSLDFTGRPIQVRKSHSNGTNNITLYDNYTYDEAGRLLKQWQTIDGVSGSKLIAYNKYDELGQLIQKKVGGIYAGTASYTATAPLQTVDYSYTIRGWLKGINNIADNLSSSTDLFAFSINYNTVTLGGTALYNGNIAETHWKSKTDNKIRSYSYSYDALDRLTSAAYYNYNYFLPQFPTQPEKYTEGSITYDKNGNIQHLERYGLKTNNTTDKIDVLTYSYMPYSNKLKGVSDEADSAGFNNGTTGTGNDYSYDLNGNMQADLNKDIGTATTTGIIYNHLNLPTKISFNSTRFIEYTYTAGGAKLQKKVTDNSTVTTTRYDHGFQYVGGVLDFFPHPEGYVRKEANGTFSYIYQYKDHLGNIRLSYRDADNNGTIALSEVLEENNYYAFGMQHKGYNNTVVSTNNYKYNGKEFQDELGLGWYDYQARNYDPILGRWFNIDPLAEKMRRWSSYNYCFDNPMKFTDPDGMGPTDVIFGGESKDKAFAELQKSVQGQLNLSMDIKGNISYTSVQGAKIDANATQLTTAIDDHSITVVVNATTDNTKPILGDSFDGNKITGDTVLANQTLNPDITRAADDFYGKPGANTLHAVTEGYQGAIISKASGVSAEPAIMGSTGGEVPNPIYDLAHKSATPQSGPISAGFVNSNGDIVTKSTEADHLSIYVYKPNDALEINSLPIPK